MRTPRSLLVASATGSATVAAMMLTSCGSTAAQGPAGSHPATSGGASAPVASGRSATGSHTCRMSALKISLDTAAAAAAAGSSYVPLEFRNISARACTLPDFPLVSFAAGSAGPDIGKPAVHEHATKAQTLTLAPGEFAHAWLQIISAANYPARSCKPVTAQGLRVRLATAARTSFVVRDIPACALPLQGSSILAVFPVQAGRAARGTAP